MKFKILFFALLVSVVSWGQILTFDFAALAGNEATAVSNFNDPNLTTSTISRGAGLAAAANGARYNAINWATTSIANAVTANSYMEFTITPNSGYEFSVSSVVIQLQRSATGPSAIVLRNSLDGYAANLDIQYAIVDNTATQTFTFTFSQPSSPTAVTYRMYMYAEAAAGSGGPGDGTGNDIIVNGIVNSTSPCTTPTSQASTITNANTTVGGTDITWSPGATATGSIVVIRPTASANALPVSGTNYTPNIAWASAGQIDVNNRVVYRSNGSSVSGITGLLPETSYTITIYSYNGGGTNICYNTTTPESYTFMTLAAEATAHAASFTCLTASATTINLSFSAANTIGGDGYIVLYRIGAAPTGVPTDGAFHPAGTVFGDATVHGYTSNNGTQVTYPATGLSGGTTYYFSLVPFSSYLSDPSTLNYRTVATIPVTTCSTSIAPEMNVRGVIGANPTIADGDTTPQGTDNTLFATVVIPGSQAKVFRIENTGNAVLNITSITMVGGNNTDFVVSGITLPTTIAAGASLDFTVTFTPGGAGVRNTTVTIANNDANENPYNFLIQGNGTLVASVEMNVKGNGQSIPDNSIYPIGTNWTAFGVATVGVSTVTRTFTIENLGSTSLNLTGVPYVTVTGPHASMFTVTVQPSTGSISGSSSVTFDVVFNPTSPGAKNATIVIANNDSDENPYNFNISGTAKGANNIYVYGNGNDVLKGSTTTSVTNLTHFGSVAVTTGIKQNTFVVSNLSGVPTYFSNVTISGADAAMFTVVSQPTNNSLASGNSTSFTLNFTPTSSGTKNATVTFNVFTDAARTIPEPIDPVFTFAISGNGIIFTPCSNNATQTLAIQDFETSPATPTYGYAYTTDGTVNVTGGTYDNGSGPKNAFIGARSFQFAGIGTSGTKTTVITMSSIDVSQYNNINLSLKVGAFRTGTTQGLDINEMVQVETSIDGGTNWSTEAVLRAYSNSRWDFNATGVFNAYYTGTNNGATIDTRNGNAELANGIATYYVKNLPAVPNLLIRFTLNADRADEIWAIDDIKIEGQLPVTSTWDGSNWLPAAPNSSTKAIFDGDFVTSVNGNVQACECEIKSGRTVVITANNYIESQSNIKNSGTLNIADDGSLVQVNDDATNTGTISYERIASMRKSDYVFWSSPIEGFSINNVSPLSPTNLIWKWSTTTPNTNGGIGTWISANGNTMGAGEGYIVRGPNTFDDASFQNFTATFSGGKQNNGVINVPIARGAMTASTLATYTSANGVPFTVNDDNWNLVGNPYPSSIRALDFLNANTNIEGAVRLWTHGTLPVSSTNPFYGTYQYNYTSSDYITHNGTGTVSGPVGFNGYIAGGQAFFVLMNEGTAATSSVVFNNSMRSRTYDNSQFYRNSNEIVNSENEGAQHRIWLDLVNSNNQPIRTLIGYVDGATLEKDRIFDAFGPVLNTQNIYSLIGEDYMSIQGRPNPFDVNDKVQIGVRIPSAGNYTIAIAALDGIFATDQKVYLEDKQLNVIHDLKSAPYAFSSELGTFNNRFELRYTSDNALSNPTFNIENSVIVSVKDNNATVTSTQEVIRKVEVFDVLGRSVLTKNDCNSMQVAINKNLVRNQVAVFKIHLQNGQIVTKKVIL
ncbi:MAG: choice-of-anchor D domain-containing protein [Flavobacterium sp.]|nr:choice-of-anchor D domain-containing protein [Flavobacterium sp.]